MNDPDKMIIDPPNNIPKSDQVLSQVDSYFPSLSLSFQYHRHLSGVGYTRLAFEILAPVNKLGLVLFPLCRLMIQTHTHLGTEQVVSADRTQSKNLTQN